MSRELFDSIIAVFALGLGFMIAIIIGLFLAGVAIRLWLDLMEMVNYIELKKNKKDKREDYGK